MAHQKHAKLVKPKGGEWGRNEVAILGAPCGEIKELVAEITKELSPEWQMAFVDAEHNKPARNEWSALNYGAKMQLTNNISHYSMDFKGDTTPFFNDADLVIVNGNHFKAEAQIAWIHPKKSLEKKLEKLNNVDLIILQDGEVLPDYLKSHLSGKDYTAISRSNIQEIKNYFRSLVTESTAPLNGLVLLGGHSTRMQKDKSQLIYHLGQPQHQYLSNLLTDYCENVYLSVRDEAQANEYQIMSITDKFIGLGPYGGILSAFQHNPNTAWLVVAVDLPFIDKNTLDSLTNNRNPHKAATCFIDRYDEFPEPLITIWEPRAYPLLLNFLAKGFSCPRKALINSDVEIITERDIKSLTNVNTPEEYQLISTEVNEK